MLRRTVRLAALLSATLLSACAHHVETKEPNAGSPSLPAPLNTAARKVSAEPPASDAATLAALDRILAGSSRGEPSRARDAARHPRETLQFFGIRSDMTVMEVWPGGNGWYAEILAPLLRDHGHYIAAEHDPLTSNYARDNVAALKAKFEATPLVYSHAAISALQSPSALSPAAPGSVDMVLTFRNLHNWLPHQGMAPSMLQAMYTVLKPGGILGIVDHRADPSSPADPLAKLGYVSTQTAIDLAEQAGFEFLGASEINANPRDTRDYDQGVWTLPPTFRLGEKDRDRYIAIGESDRFTLRFRKPLTAR